MPELSKMIEALGFEVETIRERGGGAQLELRGGERDRESLGFWIYRFVVTEDLNLRDETPVRVIVDQQEASGILVSNKDGVVVVSLESDLGANVATARLITDDAFLVERLKERLEKIERSEVKFNRVSSKRVICREEILTYDDEPAPEVFNGRVLNEEQINAVKRSLGSDTTFIWGPPGTGKTTTLARVIEAHYRAGRTVLLVSNTNIAVDTALERVAERLEKEDDFDQGLVIRYGSVVKKELRQNFGSKVILKDVVSRIGAPLLKEQEALMHKEVSLKNEKGPLYSLVKDAEQLRLFQNRIASVEKEKSTILSRVAAQEKEAEAHHVKANYLHKELGHATSTHPILRFFKGLNPERIKHEISKREAAELGARRKAEILTHPIPKLDERLVELHAKKELCSSRVDDSTPVDEILKRLGALEKQLEEIGERKGEISQQLEHIKEDTLLNCKVLATTVYRTYLSKDVMRQFDTVVIDEASMLMLPLTYYVAGLAGRSVVVAGDFRQLSPIVMSKERLVEEWLKCDVFEKAKIPDKLNTEMPYLVALQTQYRMREPICSVVNDLFYDNQLKTHPSANEVDESFPLPDKSLLYINTESFNPWAAFRVGTYSRYNLLHALLVRNIVLHFAKRGYLPLDGVNDVIGVVSPYASQAQLIQTLLTDSLKTRVAGIAATVHRFQGNEKKVMIIDLTDSLGARLGRFFKATRKDEDGSRLLNVAVSRAKQHVILVGNFSYIKEKAPPDSTVSRLIDHFVEKGEKVELDTLLPKVDSKWMDGLHRMTPPSLNLPKGAFGFFTEATFYSMFLKDLTEARDSIVIFSPFVTSNGISNWVEALRTALGRGVRVHIFAKPASEFGGGTEEEVRMLIAALRNLGVSVDLRNKMHEKIIVIDGRIFWNGSLNILSHRNTYEFMQRTDSSEACKKVLQLVGSPRGRGVERPELFTSDNPPCPNCSGPTVWNTRGKDIWFKCEDETCGGTINPRGPGRGRRARPDAPRQGNQQVRPCPQQECDGQLVEKNGRFGLFIGCSNYRKGCRYTEKV